MSSADSVRVETDDRRRWWEFRLLDVGREGTEELLMGGKEKVARELSEGEEVIAGGWLVGPAGREGGKDEMDILRECEREWERLWPGLERLGAEKVEGRPPSLKDSNCGRSGEYRLTNGDWQWERTLRGCRMDNIPCF